MSNVITIQGAPAAGPGTLHVLQAGPESAKRVLVLIAGRGESAGGLRLVARDLVDRVPNLQVWAIARRQHNLADLKGFRAGGDEAVRYYLDTGYVEQDAASAPYAAQWGLDLELRDVREVVLAARAGGRREVVLGGHSLGATAVLDYAAWDFDGVPGYTDLHGMMLLDGGVRDALSGAGIEFSITADGVHQWLTEIENGVLFDNATSLYNNFGDKPEAAALWYQLVAQQALAAPHRASVIAHRLPDAIRPDRELTNAGLLGWLVDEHAALPGYAVNSGHLDNGDWVDEGRTPLHRVATAMAASDVTAWEWYSPHRLALDYHGTAAYTDDDVTRTLGLPLRHVHAINVPLYAFQSNLTNGTVCTAAEDLVSDTKIPSISTHTDEAMTHLDILFAAPEHNSFVRTAVEFLTKLD